MYTITYIVTDFKATCLVYGTFSDILALYFLDINVQFRSSKLLLWIQDMSNSANQIYSDMENMNPEEVGEEGDEIPDTIS